MAKDSENKSGVNQQYNSASAGLNLDNSQNNIEKGQLSYALNAGMENFDANSVQYQNEPGNELCFEFPEGYKLIAKHFIPEQDRIIFFLVNPDTNSSEIGYMINNDCNYQSLVNDDCLNFDINHPVLRMVHKITNFGTEIYWADNNGRRYLDIENIPYIPVITSDVCDPEDSHILDCNKLSLLPDINIPFLEVEDVISGGEITSGTYQFAVQYSDAVGNPYTSYYGVTNPTPIADINVATVNFNIPVGRSIVLYVQNLEPLGQYQYFNLAVIKTINNIPSVELVGTYFIDDIYKKITYTGQNKTQIKLSINDIFEKFTYYNKADYVTSVQDILVWKGVTALERLNYQKIANGINLQWQTYRIPANESYANEVNATNYRGYLRDEVYAFEIVFLLKSGKETDAFHIPGRKKNIFELTAKPIDQSNPDFIGEPDVDSTTSPYWKIYNTATVSGVSSEYTEEDNYKGPYQYGEFAYWESSEEYPCDTEIWGELAGERIRHHKFPDVLVSPIIESSSFTSVEKMIMEDVAVYPIGVKINTTQIKNLINKSDLTKKQKEDIVGYKIVRANRGVNKSIIAKGMLRNVGKYEKEQQTYYYPNYPYNDLQKDPFINNINNAWIAECEPYTLDIKSFTEFDDEGGYLELRYIDCNTNKEITKKFRGIGPRTIGAIGAKPTILGGGIYNKIYYNKNLYPQPKSNNNATLSYNNYDVWICRSTTDLGKGWRAGWDFDYMSDESEDVWVYGAFNKPRTRYVYVKAGTSVERIGGGDKGIVRKVRYSVRDDNFLSGEDNSLDPVGNNNNNNGLRQIFNSPETSFGQPFLGNILKLESVMFGPGKAHFVEVKDNAKYKLLTKEAQLDALRSSEEIGDITDPFSTSGMMAAYQSYLTIYINGITRRNYAYSFNSIASYNYTVDVPNNIGQKQRVLDIKRYLIPQVISVGEKDGTIINNWQRETSVFLRTDENISSLPYPHNSQFASPLNIQEYSRFTLGDTNKCGSPEAEENINVTSYYASIKNDFINQYGQIGSYESIDTGFVKLFDAEELNNDVIFGGDTFIGKFAYKTKVPFFIDNRVNAPDDSDIFYDEIGNIGYPRFWHSSRSILEDYAVTSGDGATLSNFISYKAHNFDCPNDQGPEELEDGQEVKDFPDRTFYDGYMYMFAYGIPSFYCESSYNVDLRTATNNKEGDFWPHVSTGIPDEWVQETNVTIAWDNVYNYNVTYSKQNKESVITKLPADWGTGTERVNYPFRTIYSDRQNTDADNRVNNWLIYRPVSYFDFPQNYGNLIALDGLKNSAILARFENKSLLYNNLLTLDSSNPQSVYIGNPKLFSTPPIDYAETDQGYVGTQNKFLLKTPYGVVSVDAKRGRVFLINGPEIQDLAMFGTGMNRWFTAHLPFEILKYFPHNTDDESNDINIDNHFNGIGLHGVFDTNYDRIIITKIDYIPLDDDISYEENKFYITKKGIKKEIFLLDSDYFCNVSWTLSFNFNTNSWISFHSYIPNWYVGENNFFYSGLNNCPNDFDALVGTLDGVVPTSTTTTTEVPSTTTTTTTAFILPDCTFDVAIDVRDCDLEGTAEFVDAEIIPCYRPNILRDYILYTGYTLENPVSDVDSTISSDVACSHLSYIYILTGSEGYVAKTQEIEASDLEIGTELYVNNVTKDCTTVDDGWYFETDGNVIDQVFNVVGGVITEFVTCNTNITTTTTTTTVLPTQTYCFTGLYTEPDPLHPLGGTVEYENEFGDTIFVAHIWDTDYISVNASSIIATVGAIEIACTTTTTTTIV